jgi:hypothetical protein
VNERETRETRVFRCLTSGPRQGGFTTEKIVEYTDAPTTETSIATGADTCPICGGHLPEGARSCPHCDWNESETAEGMASDNIAVLLSVIPGLGHVYKGYQILGLLFFVGALGALMLALLAATATAGFGLGLAAFYWVAVMIHVYVIKDRVAPATNDQGEEY